MPANMLAGMEGKEAVVTIGQGDITGLTAEIQEAIGGRPVVQLTLEIDGKQATWNNPNAPVTVSMSYTPTAEELANAESIVVYHIDGEDNLVCVPNGRYDAER